MTEPTARRRARHRARHAHGHWTMRRRARPTRGVLPVVALAVLLVSALVVAMLIWSAAENASQASTTPCYDDRVGNRRTLSRAPAGHWLDVYGRSGPGWWHAEKRAGAGGPDRLANRPHIGTQGAHPDVDAHVFILECLVSLTPEQRSLRARIAANARWSRENGARQGAILRAGFIARFEREVDPDGTLPPAERSRRAQRAMQAHMQRLALASSKARAGGDAA